MAYSLSDLATRSLQKAGLVAAEEVPSAADLVYAETSITSDTAALAVEGITILNGSEQIVPVTHFEPLSRYYAVTFKEDFGLISGDVAMQMRELEKRLLWKLCAIPQTGEVAEALYY